MTMKLWGSAAPGGQILPISDTDFAKGFYYLGNNPPTAEEFNWLFQQITQGIIDASRGWQANKVYNLGEIIHSTTLANSMKMFECTVAGASGLTEPTWGAVGTTITDGTCQWKVYDIRQGISIGRIPSLVDVGGGKAGLPAVSGKLLTDIDSGMPIGSCLPFLSSVAPPGWLACDTGALVSRATYPQLWAWVQANAPLVTEAAWQAQAAVQTSVGYYSSGDGSTTFRLPRLVDFVRGADGTRLPGSFQLDALQGHWHNVETGSATGGVRPGSNASDSDNRNVSDTGGTVLATWAYSATTIVTDFTNGTPRIASETRGKSIAMLYCVKAFDAPTNQGLIDITQLANSVAGKVNLTDFTGNNQNKAANGYQILPGGLIIQWGTYPTQIAVNVNATITFPVTFPNSVLSITGSYRVSAISATIGPVFSVLSYNNSQFVQLNDAETGNNTGFFWMAIGY